MRISNLRFLLVVIVALACTVLLTGCAGPGPKESTQIPVASRPAEPDPVPQVSRFVTLLDFWWISQWSSNGLVLDIMYTKGRNTLTEVIHRGSTYSPFGEPLTGSEVRTRTGEDIYGRVQNVTISTIAVWHGSAKPDTLAAAGTFRYPATGGDENVSFTRSFNLTITGTYDASGRLTGGRGSERYSGELLTADGAITYAGTATGSFAVNDGALVWTERAEKTSYSYHGEPYAETAAVIRPESAYLGGGDVKVRETVSTTTTYADGSFRESDLVLVWQRNSAGVTSGRSGSGTVRGTELVNGTAVEYTGTISLDYGFDTRLGWFKSGYHEARSAERALPKRLPFEVVYNDDLYLRPVF